MFFRALLFALALWPLAAGGEPLPAAPPAHRGGKQIRLVWTETPPTIDGVIDEAVWRQATHVDDFTQTFPYVGGEPSQRTEVFLLTDGHTLFVAFRAWDTEVERIVAKRMLRDSVDMFWDDRVNLVLDTFHDRRNGFFFQMNPVGSRRDGTVSGPLDFENNWDGIWEGRATIDAEGWSVEWAIPFQTLNFDPNLDAWGINFERGIRRDNQEMRWADPDQRRTMTNVSQAGVITGLHGVHQGIGLDVVPSFRVSHLDDRLPVDHLGERHEWDYDPSFDAYYKLLPSVTAAATVHSDFGETEVDDVQVTLNRFALLFPEKRDFFLQDEGIFRFGGLADNGRPFFSRNIGQPCFPGFSLSIDFENYCDRNLQGTRGLGIQPDGEPVDILGGAKVTGRVGNWNIGLLDAYIDRQPPKFQDRANPSVFVPERDSRNLAVARLSYNLLDESRLGVIATNGNPYSDDDNTLAGVDLNLRDSDIWHGNAVEARAWMQRSFTEGRERRRAAQQGLSGGEWAWGAALAYPNDLINWNLNVMELQSDFLPALGFVNRPGIRQYDGGWRYRYRPHDSIVRTADFRLNFLLVTSASNRLPASRGIPYGCPDPAAAFTTSKDGEIQTYGLAVRPLRVETHAGDSIELRYARRFEHIDSTFAFKRANPAALAAGTLDRGGVGVCGGSYANHEATALIETSRSRSLRADLETGGGEFYDGYRFLAHPKLEWRPSKHLFLSFDYEHNELWSIGPLERNFRFRVVRGRVSLQLTPDLSWITIVQYDNVSDAMGVQGRVRWIVEEGREIFFVVNEGVDTRDGDLDLIRSEPLAKIGWTFRF
jgi:hypothetical protein